MKNIFNILKKKTKVEVEDRMNSCIEINFSGTKILVCGNAKDNYFIHAQKNLEEQIKFCDLIEKIRKYREKDSLIVIDIGANIGLTTLAMHARLMKEVFSYSIEPSPKNFSYLVENIKNNNIKNNACFQVAISDRKGELKFLEDLQGAGNHIVTEHHIISKDSSNACVETETLDQFVEKNKIKVVDIIKIDVEGFEKNVLDGGEKTIKKFMPVIYMEFNSWTLIAHKNQNPRLFLDYLIEEFPFIYQLDGEKHILRIRSDREKLEFLHKNLTMNGCVDDLIISFEEIF